MSMGNTSMLIDIDVDDQKKWVTARTISRLRCNSQLKTTSNNFRLDFEHDDVAEATTGIQGDSYIHSFPLRSDNDVSEQYNPRLQRLSKMSFLFHDLRYLASDPPAARGEEHDDWCNVLNLCQFAIHALALVVGYSLIRFGRVKKWPTHCQLCQANVGYVSIGPGATLVTLMPLSPSSFAAARQKCSTGAFAPA